MSIPQFVLLLMTKENLTWQAVLVDGRFTCILLELSSSSMLRIVNSG